MLTRTANVTHVNTLYVHTNMQLYCQAMQKVTGTQLPVDVTLKKTKQHTLTQFLMANVTYVNTLFAHTLTKRVA